MAGAYSVPLRIASKNQALWTIYTAAVVYAPDDAYTSLVTTYKSQEENTMSVNKDMTIAEVLKLDRGTAPIFMEFGMHCLGCPHATGESLEQAGMAHGIDVGQLVEKLNDFLGKTA